jgi:DNA/RNA-binding domain of Phe-tRNA-synthetase-like protein
MTLIVSEDCLHLGLRAGAVVFRNLRIAPSDHEQRLEILDQVQKIRTRFADPSQIRATPEVEAFREILRKVGVNPRREQPSVERLLTFAFKRGELPAINTLVDAYNLISVRSLCSLGAHDLDKIALPVALRFLTGNESFTPLGSDTAATVDPKEFGYVDAAGRVLCRLDLLQADFSKVTTATVNALLIIESTTAHEPTAASRAFEDAIALVTRYCGGSAEVVSRP